MPPSLREWLPDVRHERALADTFTQVLVLCARAGLVSVALVAIDGSLIAGDASRRQRHARYAGDPRGGRRRSSSEAAEVDAAEDEQFGDAARRRTAAPGCADRRSRLERLRRCRRGTRGRASRRCRPIIEANLRWRAQWEAEHGRKLGGRKPTPPDPDGAGHGARSTRPIPTPGRCSRAGGRSVQGFNVAGRRPAPEQVILAARRHPGRQRLRPARGR